MSVDNGDYSERAISFGPGIYALNLFIAGKVDLYCDAVVLLQASGLSVSTRLCNGRHTTPVVVMDGDFVKLLTAPKPTRLQRSWKIRLH